MKALFSLHAKDLNCYETFEKCSILFKLKEDENLSADASLRVTVGIH